MNNQETVIRHFQDAIEASGNNNKWRFVRLDIIEDAIELLKAQEPRVLTLEEIKEGEPYWFDAGKGFEARHVICVHREDDAQKPYITFVWKFGTFSWLSEYCGKTWRVWSAKPTDEQ